MPWEANDRQRVSAGEPLIAIVADAADDHAAAVMSVLRTRGHLARLIDTGEYPIRLRLTMKINGDTTSRTLRDAEGETDLDSIGAVWWRRPRPYTLDPELDGRFASFALAESHEALSGVWSSMDVAWVNPQSADETAHHKPFQLVAAGEVGLTIPDTLITNDPRTARAFIAERGPARTIYKTFLATEEHWRETRVLTERELELLDQVTLAPAIFQNRVEAFCDIRVTIVGDDMFATAIEHAADGYDVDYRVDIANATFQRTVLPAEVEDALRRLMVRLGLIYGAIDLLQTHHDQFVFLEINPAGEWRFVEERTGQTITDAMASLLARLDRQGDR